MIDLVRFIHDSCVLDNRSEAQSDPEKLLIKINTNVFFQTCFLKNLLSRGKHKREGMRLVSVAA